MSLSSNASSRLIASVLDNNTIFLYDTQAFPAKHMKPELTEQLAYIGARARKASTALVTLDRIDRGERPLWPKLDSLDGKDGDEFLETAARLGKRYKAAQAFDPERPRRILTELRKRARWVRDIGEGVQAGAFGEEVVEKAVVIFEASLQNPKRAIAASVQIGQEPERTISEGKDLPVADEAERRIVDLSDFPVDRFVGRERQIVMELIRSSEQGILRTVREVGMEVYRDDIEQDRKSPSDAATTTSAAITGAITRKLSSTGFFIVKEERRTSEGKKLPNRFGIARKEILQTVTTIQENGGADAVSQTVDAEGQTSDIPTLTNPDELGESSTAVGMLPPPNILEINETIREFGSFLEDGDSSPEDLRNPTGEELKVLERDLSGGQPLFRPVEDLGEKSRTA